MTVEYSTQTEITVTIALGDSGSGVANLVVPCRWIRMWADGIDAGDYYRPIVSFDGVGAYWPVYVNTVLQRGPADGLYCVWEIGYSAYVTIIASSAQAAIRTIKIRGYSL